MAEPLNNDAPIDDGVDADGEFVPCVGAALRDRLAQRFAEDEMGVE